MSIDSLKDSSYLDDQASPHTDVIDGISVANLTMIAQSTDVREEDEELEEHLYDLPEIEMFLITKTSHFTPYRSLPKTDQQLLDIARYNLEEVLWYFFDYLDSPKFMERLSHFIKDAHTREQIKNTFIQLFSLPMHVGV